jgi:hypothetical protein
MDQLQLYLNDQLVDLIDDNPIALTFQINNLAEVKNQQGNTSNQFKLLLTQRNRQILGFPDDIAFTTNLPYQQYQAKLIQDGLEIIPYGICTLNGIDKNYANITILSGNVDFFDAIGGKLYDMGDSTSQWSNYGQNLLWKQYDHVWNLDSVAGSQGKTDGWIWPVVDYGAISTTDFNAPIDVRYQRPGFFIKTAIDLLLKSAGYKGTGSLLADPLYPLMIAQFANGSFAHGTDYQTQQDVRGLQASQTLNLNLSHPADTVNSVGVIQFDNIISDKSGQFSNNQLYTARQITDVEVTLILPHVQLTGFVNPSDKPSALEVILFNRDPNYPVVSDSAFTSFTFSFAGHGFKIVEDNPSQDDPNGFTRLFNTDGGNLYAVIDFPITTIACKTTIAQGGGVFVGYKWSGRTFPLGASAVVFAGSTLTVKSQNQIVQFGQSIQCERIFPDISQKDLLKDTLQRFGIICQTDNAGKTISFNSLRDIVNNIPLAKDWTSKCLDQGKQVAFQLGNYAQVNSMEYQNDNNVLPLKFGWSQIYIR